jgi:thiamine-phosphate pyrophosphorylase
MEARPEPAARQRAEHALAATGAPSLVLTAPGGANLDAAAASPLVAAAHAMSAAVLIDADASLAREVGADGVHLHWSKEIEKTYAATRAALGPGLIVGADAGRSRHDAMSLGEAGADYIGFGIPPHVTDREGAASRRLDLVAWWAEIFEVPVVALDVETPDDARGLALAGADFIAVRVPAALADIEPWARDFMAALAVPEAVG